MLMVTRTPRSNLTTPNIISILVRVVDLERYQRRARMKRGGNARLTVTQLMREGDLHRRLRVVKGYESSEFRTIL